jgi:hypothetical protein
MKNQLLPLRIPVTQENEKGAKRHDEGPLDLEAGERRQSAETEAIVVTRQFYGAVAWKINFAGPGGAGQP